MPGKGLGRCRWCSRQQWRFERRCGYRRVEVYCGYCGRSKVSRSIEAIRLADAAEAGLATKGARDVEQ